MKSLDDSIKILGDVQGPKIRLGEMKGEQITLQAGDSFIFCIRNQLQGVVRKQVLIMKESRMM